MIPDSLRLQIDQWLDDDLPLEDEMLLKEWFETTPEAIEFLGERALLQTMLAKTTAFDLPSLHAELKITPTGLVPEMPQRPSASWFATPWMWVPPATIVCLLLISFFLLPDVVASPADLVRQTLAEYRSAIDRCYIVKIEAEGRLRRHQFKGRLGPADSKLWVRGNSFVQIFESSEETLIWGRDPRGSVWFTIARKSAAVFEANKVPDALQELCELRTLDETTLLESLLRDYDLQYTERQSQIQTIQAKPREPTNSSKYGDLEIDIDKQSRLVHRVSLERLVDKRPVAVVSFTLNEIQERDESYYIVRSHLQDDAKVLEQESRFGDRVELLREFLSKLRAINSTRVN